MQKLNVSLSISIPPEYVVISKVELEELKQQSLSGVYWTMKDLEIRTGKKHEWIKVNILYPSKFKEILDAKNGGFVFYPETRGQNWSFQAIEMSKFLDKNFNEIFNQGRKKNPVIISDIRNIIGQLGESKIAQSYFIESTYINERGREYKCYALVRTE